MTEPVLKIRTIHPEGGRPYMALVFPDGPVVPGQVATSLECAVGELPVFTVQLSVDGEHITLD